MADVRKSAIGEKNKRSKASTLTEATFPKDISHSFMLEMDAISELECDSIVE
eukprot:SAG11_NODE_25679_length_355_cov_1.273438_1_plen_52_part_00